VRKNKYDPLWKVVGEEIPLLGQDPDVDGLCPHCHVTVHLGPSARAGERCRCGLCGGVSRLVETSDGLTLQPVDG